MPWTCSGCGEVIEDTFEECWNCGTSRDGRRSQGEENFGSADLSYVDGPIHRTPLDTDLHSGPDEQVSPENDDSQTLGAPQQANTFRADRAAARVATRYSDAYLVASAITIWAWVIKVVGLAGAVAIYFAATAAAKTLGAGNEAAAGFVGFIPAAMVAVGAYVAGVLVSAQGQILKASLDSAVHSSPFLSDEQRVQIMSL